MELNLKRPIIFFDLETTGVSVTHDRIVEISYIKVLPGGQGEERKTMRINPEMPIPAQSSAVHGIYDKDVEACPKFKEVAKQLTQVFQGCDVAGFNSNRFDVPMLQEEFLRAGQNFDFSKCRFVDVQTIFHKKEQRNLIAAYKFYCGKNLEDAHSADADTNATYEVLKAQLDKYPDLENSVEFLSQYSSHNRNVDFAGRMIYNENDQPVFNFGKHKGQLVTEVLKRESGYFGWMMNGDFPLDTKQKLQQIRLGLLDK